MQSSGGYGEDCASGATRRVVRLLILLGAVVATYLVLSLFDHAARADTGLADHVGVPDSAPVQTVASSVKKVISEPKSGAAKTTAVKSTAVNRITSKQVTSKVATPKLAHPRQVTPKPAAVIARPPKIHQVASAAAEVPAAKLEGARKVLAAKIQAPKVRAAGIRAGQTVRQISVRSSKHGQPAPAAVRDVAQATLTRVRKAAVQLRSAGPAQLPSLSDLAGIPHLPGTENTALLSWPKLSSSSQLSGLPQALLPAWLHPVSLHRATASRLVQHPASTDSAELLQPVVTPVSKQLYPLVEAPACGSASGTSAVRSVAQVQSRTAPRPAAPRQPNDFSTTTGQANESGGGGAPAMGTVPSSWRPEATAAGCCLATDVITRGRTVRYAGPPS